MTLTKRFGMDPQSRVSLAVDASFVAANAARAAAAGKVVEPVDPWERMDALEREAQLATRQRQDDDDDTDD